LTVFALFGSIRSKAALGTLMKLADPIILIFLAHEDFLRSLPVKKIT